MNNLNKFQYALNVIMAVCEYYEVNINQIFSKSRERKAVEARHTVMYLLWHKERHTIMAIARMFNRDHSTVSKATQQVRNHMDTNYFEKDKHIIYKWL